MKDILVIILEDMIEMHFTVKSGGVIPHYQFQMCTITGYLCDIWTQSVT